MPSTALKSVEIRELMPVSVETLLPSDAFDFELYIQSDNDSQARLYRERNYPISEVDLQRLLDRDVTTLYIPTADTAKYSSHLKENVLTDERVPPVRRYEVLKEATRVMFTEAFMGRQIGPVVETTEELGTDIVNIVCGCNLMLSDLFGVMTHDYSTFAHATNVATYSVLLAQQLGITKQQELAEIGQGALLHDFGKQYIPAEILNKEGRLTEQEMALIRTHPEKGFEELSPRSDLSWGQLMMIYQHHEREDGSGYPIGLVGKEIHAWGRMCAIADVFDALTRDRSYRRGSSKDEVLSYLSIQRGRGFDEEMVECWISVIRGRA